MIPFSFMRAKTDDDGGPGECLPFGDVDSWTLVALGTMHDLPDGFALAFGTEVVFDRIALPDPSFEIGGHTPVTGSLYRAINPFVDDAQSHDGYIYLSAIEPGAPGALYWSLAMDRITNESTPLSPGVFATHTTAGSCSDFNPSGGFCLYADLHYATINFSVEIEP